MKLKPDPRTAGAYMFYCPACHIYHSLHIDIPAENGAQWRWNYNMDKPTVRPSYRYETGAYADPRWSGADGVRCCGLITDGRIQYSGESSHALSGYTVELPTL